MQVHWVPGLKHPELLAAWRAASVFYRLLRLLCCSAFATLPGPQAKHLTRDQYAMNHPAGRIGKRLMLRVADVMIRCGFNVLRPAWHGPLVLACWPAFWLVADLQLQMSACLLNVRHSPGAQLTKRTPALLGVGDSPVTH